MANANLSRDYPLAKLVDLLKSDAPAAIIADWLQGEAGLRWEPVDVCLLYARDEKSALGVLPPCPECGKVLAKNRKGATFCAGCDQAWAVPPTLALLPCTFRQDFFGAYVAKEIDAKAGTLAASGRVERVMMSAMPTPQGAESIRFEPAFTSMTIQHCMDVAKPVWTVYWPGKPKRGKPTLDLHGHDTEGAAWRDLKRRTLGLLNLDCGWIPIGGGTQVSRVVDLVPAEPPARYQPRTATRAR